MLRCHRLLLGAVLCVVMCGLLSGCTQWFFFPSKPLVQTPENIGYAYQDVFLQSSDGARLHAWLVEPNLAPGQAQPNGLVYFLHGNAQNISWHIMGARWLLESGYRVFALDYRGYGLSTGVADIPEVYSGVVIFGQSLGASLSLNWLGRNPQHHSWVSKVVLDSGFSRFDTVAKEVAGSHWLTWLFQYPAKWMLADERDPVDAIGSLNMPIMLVHSVNDTVVSYAHSSIFRPLATQRYAMRCCSG